MKTFLKLLYDCWAPLGIPLAWRQLMAERKRFLAAVAGITFAVTMMMFQMGLQSALFTQVVAPHLLLDADLVITHRQYEYFGISRSFTAKRLYQAYALPEVRQHAGLYLGNLPMKHPVTGENRDVFIIGFDPAQTPFSDPQILANQHKIQRDGVALFDIRSREEFGPFAKIVSENGYAVTEVSGKRIRVEGTFAMGATFAADGNILVSKDTFLQIWNGAHPNMIMVGLLKLTEGTNSEETLKKLRPILPDDVTIYTREAFIEMEKNYWRVRTPIGFVITASMIVGLIVGAVIVYQILYTDVTDHLPEYATLKSIGFRDGYFIRLILQESVILSVCGFIPGALLTAVLFALTREYAYMPTYLTNTIVFSVFFLTLFMCSCAGALATRRLRQANPGEIN